MNFYTLTSKMYDVLDHTYFSDQKNNPRNRINRLIPNEKLRILDMCCGTLANSIPIANDKENVKILGIDASKQMLQVARRKTKKEGLENIYLKCADATDTGLKNESFDYIVIGLALHEMDPELKRKILAEAHRLLKTDGSLIIMEWEKSRKMTQKILFFPLMLGEQALCKSFFKFYRCDKQSFFEKNGFATRHVIHCNYTVVMELKKIKQDEL